MKRETGVFALAVLIGLTGAGLAAASLIREPEVVVGTVVVTPEGSPISRWYVETDRGGIRRLAEIGPGLAAFDCFEPGDVYVDGSLGRCEDVVWP